MTHATSNIRLVNRETGAVQELPETGGVITATHASDLHLDLPPSQVLGRMQVGDDLIINLSNGGQIIVRDFFAFARVGDLLADLKVLELPDSHADDGSTPGSASEPGTGPKSGMVLGALAGGLVLAGAAGGGSGSGSDLALPVQPDLAPTQAAPAQVTPTQITPTQVAPTQATSTQITPTQVTPTQATDQPTDAERALQTINAYNGNNTPPTVATYTTAGVDGVTAANLAGVNAQVLAAINANLVASMLEGFVANTDTARQTINAWNGANTPPTTTDYRNAGIDGVTPTNLPGVNAQLQSLPSSMRTPSRIDGFITTTNTALQTINAYHGDKNAYSGGEKAPTITLYAAIGVDGVTAANLAGVNAQVAASTDNMLTADDITGFITATATALDTISAYTGDNNAPTVTDYRNAGVDGVTDANLDAVNAQIKDATETLTTTAVQMRVATVEALALINAWDGTADAPTFDDYAAAGVTGITGDRIGVANMLLAATNMDRDADGAITAEQLQHLLDIAEDMEYVLGVLPPPAALTVTTGSYLIRIDIDDDGSPDQFVHVETDADGAPTSITYDFDNDGSMDRRDRFIMNASKNRLESAIDLDVDGTPEWTETYTENAAGHRIRTAIHTNGDGSADQVETYTMNPAGVRLAAEFDTDADGTPNRRETYILNAQGKRIRTDFDDDADGTTDRSEVPAIRKQVTMAERATAALAKIHAYQTDQDNAEPTLKDYRHAGALGVTATILDAVNARMAMLSAPQTPAQINVLAQALATISTFDGNDPAPTLADYLTIGVTGVSGTKLALLNALLQSANASDNVPFSVRFLQHLVDALADVANAPNVLPPTATVTQDTAFRSANSFDFGIDHTADNTAEWIVTVEITASQRILTYRNADGTTVRVETHTLNSDGVRIQITTDGTDSNANGILEPNEFSDGTAELTQLDDDADGTIDNSFVIAVKPKPDDSKITIADNNPVTRTELDTDADGTVDGVAVYTVNDRGQRTYVELDHDNDGTVEETQTNTYNDQGLLARQVIEYDNGEGHGGNHADDGTVDKRDTRTFSYDQQGMLTQEIHDPDRWDQRSGQNVLVRYSRNTREFDSEGNLTRHSIDTNRDGLAEITHTYNHLPEAIPPLKKLLEGLFNKTSLPLPQVHNSELRESDTFGGMDSDGRKSNTADGKLEWTRVYGRDNEGRTVLRFDDTNADGFHEKVQTFTFNEQGRLIRRSLWDRRDADESSRDHFFYNFENDQQPKTPTGYGRDDNGDGTLDMFQKWGFAELTGDDGNSYELNRTHTFIDNNLDGVWDEIGFTVPGKNTLDVNHTHWNIYQILIRDSARGDTSHAESLAAVLTDLETDGITSGDDIANGEDIINDYGTPDGKIDTIELVATHHFTLDQTEYTVTRKVDNQPINPDQSENSITGEENNQPNNADNELEVVTMTKSVAGLDDIRLANGGPSELTLPAAMVKFIAEGDSTHEILITGDTDDTVNLLGDATGVFVGRDDNSDGTIDSETRGTGDDQKTYKVYDVVSGDLSEIGQILIESDIAIDIISG